MEAGTAPQRSLTAVADPHTPPMGKVVSLGWVTTAHHAHPLSKVGFLGFPHFTVVVSSFGLSGCELGH